MAKKRQVQVVVKDLKAKTPKHKAVRLTVGIKGRKEKLTAEGEAPTKNQAILGLIELLANHLCTEQAEHDKDYDALNSSLDAKWKKLNATESKTRRRQLGLVVVPGGVREG